MFHRVTLALLLLAMTSWVLGLHSTPPGEAAPTLYGVASESDSEFFSVDPTTGTATFIGDTGFDDVSAIAFHPTTATLYAIGRNPDEQDSSLTEVLFTINITTGVGTLIGPLGVDRRFTDMSFRSDGVLFAYGKQPDSSTASLYTVNLVTGAATEIGATGACSQGNGMAFAPGGTLWLASCSSLDTLNTGTGAATNAHSMSLDGSDFVGRINALDFQPSSGTLFGVLNNDIYFLVTVDTSTGGVTTVGETQSSLDAIAFVPSLGQSPTSTPTTTATLASSATPTRTPTPTVTREPLISSEPNRQNVGGAVGAIAAAAGKEAQGNRNAEATSAAVAAVSVGSIRPPATGDAGLK